MDIESFSGDQRVVTSSAVVAGREVSSLESDCGGVTVKATVKCQGKTGVEMEALTAAMMGTVTMYDMLKGVDKGMVIVGARVVEKKGGKSGDWVWDESRSQLVRADGQEQEQVRVGTQGQVGESQAEGTLSEVQEWNEGLAGEFSIKDEVEVLEEKKDQHR